MVTKVVTYGPGIFAKALEASPPYIWKSKWSYIEINSL